MAADSANWRRSAGRSKERQPGRCKSAPLAFKFLNVKTVAGSQGGLQIVKGTHMSDFSQAAASVERTQDVQQGQMLTLQRMIFLLEILGASHCLQRRN